MNFVFGQIRPYTARIWTRIGATGTVFHEEARWHGFERFRQKEKGNSPRNVLNAFLSDLPAEITQTMPASFLMNNCAGCTDSRPNPSLVAPDLAENEIH